MTVQIKASPQIRDSIPRAHKPRPQTARFVLRDRPQRPATRDRGATRILKVTFVLLLLGTGAHALWSKLQGPDPHYLTAQKLVRDYEFGRPKKIRNYEHVTYRQALAELALVDSRSQSAEAAQTLQLKLERSIAEFRAQQDRINNQLSMTRVKSRKKIEREFQAHLHSLQVPQTEWPECELEGQDNSSGEHTH